MSFTCPCNLFCIICGWTAADFWEQHCVWLLPQYFCLKIPLSCLTVVYGSVLDQTTVPPFWRTLYQCKEPNFQAGAFIVGVSLCALTSLWNQLSDFVIRPHTLAFSGRKCSMCTWMCTGSAACAARNALALLMDYIFARYKCACNDDRASCAWQHERCHVLHWSHVDCASHWIRMLTHA